MSSCTFVMFVYPTNHEQTTGFGCTSKPDRFSGYIIWFGTGDNRCSASLMMGWVDRACPHLLKARTLVRGNTLDMCSVSFDMFPEHVVANRLPHSLTACDSRKVFIFGLVCVIQEVRR